MAVADTEFLQSGPHGTVGDARVTPSGGHQPDWPWPQSALRLPSSAPQVPRPVWEAQCAHRNADNIY